MFHRDDVMEGASALSRPGAVELPRVQAILDRYVAEKRMPGAIIAYGNVMEPPEFLKAGTIDFESTVEVDEHSLWRLASLTKLITGMATMLLIAEKKVGLDQPLAEFIQVFSQMRITTDASNGESRQARSPITIRHLMTHTSGIGSVPKAWNNEETSAPKTLAEYVERLAAQPLGCEPGTKFIYASGLEVAARVIEIVSGMPFDVFLNHRLFVPMGMHSTYFHVPERDKARLTTSYTQHEGTVIPDDRASSSSLLSAPPFPLASTSLVSTAHDYDRFLTAVANGGMLEGTIVIPAEAVELGTSNLLPPAVDMGVYRTLMRDGSGYGAAGALNLVGTWPSENFGWIGSSGTSAFFNTRLKSRLSKFTNVGHSTFAGEVDAAFVA